MELEEKVEKLRVKKRRLQELVWIYQTGLNEVLSLFENGQSNLSPEACPKSEPVPDPRKTSSIYIFAQKQIELAQTEPISKQPPLRVRSSLMTETTDQNPSTSTPPPIRRVKGDKIRAPDVSSVSLKYFGTKKFETEMSSPLGVSAAKIPLTEPKPKNRSSFLSLSLNISNDSPASSPRFEIQDPEPLIEKLKNFSRDLSRDLEIHKMSLEAVQNRAVKERESFEREKEDRKRLRELTGEQTKSLAQKDFLIRFFVFLLAFSWMIFLLFGFFTKNE